MNYIKPQLEQVISENHHNTAVDGIVICCDCGAIETTILTFGIYCRTCRNFKYFIEKPTTTYHLIGSTLDQD